LYRDDADDTDPPFVDPELLLWDPLLVRRTFECGSLMLRSSFRCVRKTSGNSGARSSDPSLLRREWSWGVFMGPEVVVIDRPRRRRPSGRRSPPVECSLWRHSLLRAAEVEEFDCDICIRWKRMERSMKVCWRGEEKWRKVDKRKTKVKFNT
jgi:hypothetical protein